MPTLNYKTNQMEKKIIYGYQHLIFNTKQLPGKSISRDVIPIIQNLLFSRGTTMKIMKITSTKTLSKNINSNQSSSKINPAPDTISPKTVNTK